MNSDQDATPLEDSLQSPAITNRYPSSLRCCPMCGEPMHLNLDAYAAWSVCNNCSYLERFGKER